MLTAEEWLPVVGYEGYYEVSNQGRVRSTDRTHHDLLGRSKRYPGKILKPAPDKRWGHLYVMLNGPARRNLSIHRLVLTAFVGPRPEGMECCHNDGDPTNNCVENLRWDTTSSNRIDSVRHGTHHQSSKTHCKRGHEFTEENTLRTRTGRTCRKCNRVSKRNSERRLNNLRKAALR